MSNQIKHDAASSVSSQYNPIAVLKPDVRRTVNAQFIQPIINSFFANRGSIESFRELDPDKLLTEVEFNDRKWSFIKEHIYKEIADEISKSITQRIVFKPKYVICFDEDLTNYDTDSSVYPYKTIFGREDKNENKIKYGVIKIGEAVILYYIYVELQEVIRFIKTIPRAAHISTKSQKPSITENEARKKLINEIIAEKHSELRGITEALTKNEISNEITRLEHLKERPLEGEKGKVRVNLMWNSTDDLDLHVITPGGEIFFSNKTIEHLGVIGKLDIDKNASEELVSNPQENINFDAIPLGKHKVIVELYKIRDLSSVPFTLTITSDLEGGKVITGVVTGEKNQRQIIFEFQDNSLIIGELS